MLRALIGAIAAGAVSAFARRAGSLSVSGQWAAFASGTICAAVGYPWAAMLVAFFATSSALTRWGAAEKARRTEAILPRGNARSALQVAANGAVFVALAALGASEHLPRLQLGALGAPGAAGAGTWATEGGTLLGGTPRSVVSWRRLPAGMSGGVTFAGSLAALAGAAFIAACARWILGLPLHPGAIAVCLGGLAGTLGDSLLGATVQARRWCDPCKEWTERRVHPCGYRTNHASGTYWMTNDAVNLAATLIGALVAMAAA